MQFSHQSGEYEKPFIFNIETAEVTEYNCNNSGFRQYHSPLLIAENTQLQLRTASGERVELNFALSENQHTNKAGAIFMIGGADKCAEIHQSITEKAGGPDNMRVAFIPAGSANSYAAGMDRKVRFEKMAGLNIDISLVPTIGDKYDFSSMQNQSRFWIVPVAILDDPETCANPKNDPDHVINDEGTYPPIDESKWNRGGFNAEVAQKLLDGNYNVFFFTGGNQTRYISAMLNSDGSDGPVLAVIRWLNKHQGAVIAGTSAGGAGLSKLMISGGGSAAAWLQGHVFDTLSSEIENPEEFPTSGDNDHRLIMGQGLGFLPENMVSDTHFFNRGRQGRLLKAMQVLSETTGQNTIGIGAGENTAALVEGNKIMAVGEQGVFVAITKHNNKFELFSIAPGDKLSFDVTEQEISVGCKLSEPEPTNANLPETLVHTDIFGRFAVGNFIGKQLNCAETTNIFGLSYSDNQLESSDFYPYENDQPENILLVTFQKTTRTEFSNKKSEIHFFGSRDRYFPEIIAESNAFDSFSYVEAIIETCQTINTPAFSEAESVLISHGRYDADEFDRYKKSCLAMLLVPFENNILLHTFFLDFAFADENDNARYNSPQGEKRSDYLILETEPAAGATIEMNSEISIADRNGLLSIAKNKVNGLLTLTTKSGKNLTQKIDESLPNAILVFANQR
ncbi:MAG: hypothetical protein CVU11_03370 [Bacteroidetes bacterium HGW-Bacteroidetes-6]|jgi:cyanophycinase|nr:MAG: hypothetical protein CVU11_03370 [Bacteroidetes bacterium HGW-Bacteroidetes-6]